MAKSLKQPLGNPEDARKLPFSKEEMFAELRYLLLIEAGRIDLMRGAPATEAFIGFPYEVDEYEAKYPDSDLKRINLGDFELTRNFDLAYDYAFQRGKWSHFDEVIEQRLRSVTHGFPEFGPEGEQNPYHSENSKCRHVAEMATARYHLAHYEASATIRDLALLANMSEAAVRNSLSAENVKPEGKPARVDKETALKWLGGRRGYIQNRDEAARGETAEQRTSRIFGGVTFQNAMRHAVFEKKLDETGKSAAEAIAKNSGVELSFVQKLMDGKPVIDIDHFCLVAQTLNLDAPKFAAYAVEQALRERTRAN